MNDLIRIYAELATFTAEDVARELQVPLGTAQSQLYHMERKGIVLRVRVEHTWLYGLAPRGLKLWRKLPKIDPEERCLLLEYMPGLDGFDSYGVPCPKCGGMVEYSIGIGDSPYRVWRCLRCGEERCYIDINDDIPF